FEQILATDDFVLDPFFIVGPSQLFPASFSAWLNHGDVVPFAQILVRRGMGLNINAIVAKVGELLPCDRLSSAQGATADAFGVDEQCEGIAVFFHDRPRHFVLRFPAVVESNYGRAWRYVFFAPLPSKQILHRDHRDTLVFQFFHLRFKGSGRNLRARIADLVDQPMVTKNKGLCGLIDHWLLDLRSCRYYRSGRRSRRPRRRGTRGLLFIRNGWLL